MPLQQVHIHLRPPADDQLQLLSSQAVQVGERDELRQSLGDAFDLQFGLIDLSAAQSVDIRVEVFEFDVDALAVGYHLVDLVVESAVGPSERSSVGCIGGLDERFFGGAVLEHADHADQLSVYFLQVEVGDFLVSDRLPEHRGQVQGEVSACPEAAAHQ